VDHNYNWHDAIGVKVDGKSKCKYNSKEPCDDNDHGTHTLGTVLGSEGETNQIGVAPGAQWIGCRNMDNGTGRPQFYMECFEFLLAPFPQGGDSMVDGEPDLGAHVINNSWGCPQAGSYNEGCESDEFRHVLKALKMAGIMVVVSAGNDGSACSTINDQPASISDLTFSVGAYSHRRDQIAGFSSRGPSLLDGEIGPDVVAPGVSIRSAVTKGKYDQWMWSGTSMAGPHVAGIVALMWSANPKLIGKVDETAELIRSTAKPKKSQEYCGKIFGSQIPNNTFGYGVVDAYAAVEAALNYQ
jgi:subtilisin family serine protease